MILQYFLSGETDLDGFQEPNRLCLPGIHPDLCFFLDTLLHLVG